MDEVTPRVLLDESDVAALWSVAGKLRERLGRPAQGSADPAMVAARLLKVRRERAALFGDTVAALLGEPVYDILLDLYVAHAAGRRISVTSACIASGVPPTTALRTIERLVASGAVRRYPDEEDRRRSLLALSEGMAGLIEQHLSAL